MARVLRIISMAGLVSIGALLGYFVRPSAEIRPKVAIVASPEVTPELDDAVLALCPQTALVADVKRSDYSISLFWLGPLLNEAGYTNDAGWSSLTERMDGVVVDQIFDPSHGHNYDYKSVIRRSCRAIMNDTSHWAEESAQQLRPGLDRHTDTLPEPTQSEGSNLQSTAPKHKKPDWFELNKPK